MADLFNIAVFYGGNEAEYGNPLADVMKSQRDTSYFAVIPLIQCILEGIRAWNSLAILELVKQTQPIPSHY